MKRIPNHYGDDQEEEEGDYDGDADYVDECDDIDDVDEHDDAGGDDDVDVGEYDDVDDDNDGDVDGDNDGVVDEHDDAGGDDNDDSSESNPRHCGVCTFCCRRFNSSHIITLLDLELMQMSALMLRQLLRLTFVGADDDTYADVTL